MRLRPNGGLTPRAGFGGQVPDRVLHARWRHAGRWSRIAPPEHVNALMSALIRATIRKRAQGGPAAASAVHQPKDETEQNAQDQAGHDRDIKCDVLPLDHDVAWQPPEPDPAQVRPQQAEQENRKPKD